jgi:hypothetical protein
MSAAVALSGGGQAALALCDSSEAAAPSVATVSRIERPAVRRRTERGRSMAHLVKRRREGARGGDD